MPTADPLQLLQQLDAGDAASVARLVEQLGTSDDVSTVVVAALFGPGSNDLLTRAAALAQSTRERQLVSIAAAHLRAERDLVDALAREHLADHPDSVIVAWIATAAHHDSAHHNTVPPPSETARGATPC